MKSYLTILMLVAGLVFGSAGFSQNKFILKKEKEAVPDSVFSVFIPAPNTGAMCLNLDSIRREISANRQIYLYWRKSREQAWYLVNIDENGKASDFRADGPANEMHSWMQQYLRPMRFQPAWSPIGNQAAQPINPGSLSPANTRTNRGSELRFALPGFDWPRFEQDYFLASLVEARCRKEKPGECVEGYVRLRVLVDAKGKTLSYEVLAGKNEWLNRAVGEELYNISFKPAVAERGGDQTTMQVPATCWTFLDFEFQTRNCR